MLRSDALDLRRRLAARMLSITMLCLIVLTCRPATADTIVFQDLTDQVSVSGTTRVALDCSAGPETCTALVSAPPGALFDAIEIGLAQVVIADPGGLVESDVIRVDPPISPSGPVSVFFSSDSEAPGLPCSGIFHGCQVTEDGTVQSVGSFFWNDGTQDTIAFQSDVNEVPEPSATLRLLATFALLWTRLGSKRPFQNKSLSAN